MEDLLQETEAAARNGLYMVALMSALSLPEMCGALGAADGEGKGCRYKKWFDKWAAPKFLGLLNGEICYAYRCGMLHQGRQMHKKLGFERVVFLEQSPRITSHLNVMDGALNIDIPEFVSAIAASVREWIASVEGTEPFESNFRHFIKRHRGGLRPYAQGIDVYC